MQARIRLFQLGYQSLILRTSYKLMRKTKAQLIPLKTTTGREANRSTPRYVMEGCTPSTPPLKTPYNISMAADCRKRHSLILLCK